MTEPRSEPTPSGRKPGRKIPALVWIVAALLVAWFVVAMLQRGGTHVTPQGGTMPEQAEGPSVAPPAPAQGDAPATPGGVVNGPNQPAQRGGLQR